jgi:TRAP-type C4-dicarboxylate transport system permease small subunit
MSGGLGRFWQRVDAALAAGMRWFVVGCLLGLFFLLTLGIVQRSVPSLKVPGYDELIELLFAWLTFIGAAALWREAALYRVGALDRLLPRAARRVVAIGINLMLMVLLWVFVVKGWEFASQSGETTPFLQFDKIWWYAAVPVSGVIMTIYHLAALWRLWRYPLPDEAPQVGLL